MDTAQQFADEELVIRAQNGDNQAMEDLLKAVRPAILRYCHFRLAPFSGGRDAADDAVQETCLAVSTVLGNYEHKGVPFRAWVYAIAAHKVVDSQRRNGRSAVLVDEFPEQVEPSPTPEEQAIATAEYEAAIALADQLPRRMRDVLLLRASGATSKRVSETLGMSIGAVNVAHHRAIRQVRELAAASDDLRELFAVRWPSGQQC
jgi:RNA polymerase sigma-70 factor (ECF subfamily)